MTRFPFAALALSMAFASSSALAQSPACPTANLMYWQAFPPGVESDLSARHQQLVLKKKCPAIETVIQYKAGGGGGLMWAQMNTLPADGTNVVGINLPHIVRQPMEGGVAYKIEDVPPVFWFHCTPDVLVVAEASPIKSFADFLHVAKADPGKLNLGGSVLSSANRAGQERFGQDFKVKTTYLPYKGTGDRSLAALGGHIDGAMTYTLFAIANKGRIRPLAVAMEARRPQMPDVPTFKELGIDWVDGACRGIGAPKSTPMAERKRLSDLFAALNADSEMRSSRPRPASSG